MNSRSLLVGLVLVIAAQISEGCGCPKGERVIVIGAGVAGLGAASELSKAGCEVVVLEAKDHLGGRMYSKIVNISETEGFVLHYGANWLHGNSPNSLWDLNEKLGLVRRQWLPASFIIRLTNGGKRTYAGRDDYIPGEHMRKKFDNFVLRHKLFDAWLQGIFDGTPADDFPLSHFIDEFFSIHNITRGSPEADEFGTLHSIYETSNAARELYHIGLGYYLILKLGDDREWMVGFPGFNTINEYLATGLDIRYNSPVRVIEWNENGVVVTTRDGQKFEGTTTVVTVPIGVLQKRGVTFVPELPYWKWRAIDGMGIGLLNKVFLRWDKIWWPREQDAFWTLMPFDDPSGRLLGVEFYNVPNIKRGFYESEPAPVLLALCAGAHAELHESKPDWAVAEELVGQLRKIFPDIDIPPPIEIIRTKWWTDEFAYGAYAAAPVGFNPLSYDYISQELGGVLYFAGEGSSRERSGFVDGAYDSGLREARKILDRCNRPIHDGSSLPNDITRPFNDAAIRAEFSEWLMPYVADDCAPDDVIETFRPTDPDQDWP